MLDGKNLTDGNVEGKLLLLCDDVLDVIYDVMGVIELFVLYCGQQFQRRW